MKKKSEEDPLTWRSFFENNGHKFVDVTVRIREANSTHSRAEITQEVLSDMHDKNIVPSAGSQYPSYTQLKSYYTKKSKEK